MLDLLNSVACLLLMAFSLPVAMTMGNRGMWFHRLSLVAVQIGLFMQMTNPLIEWLPAATWTGVYLNSASALMLCIWWRRAWLFIRSYLGPVEGPLEERRRRSDWPASQSPRPVVHTYPWSGTPPKA